MIQASAWCSLLFIGILQAMDGCRLSVIPMSRLNSFSTHYNMCIVLKRRLHMRVFSYGGGVQSTAALVLAAQRKIDYPTFLFCNVGDDSEHPASLDYVHEYAIPYAQKHGIT